MEMESPSASCTNTFLASFGETANLEVTRKPTEVFQGASQSTQPSQPGVLTTNENTKF